MKTFREFLDICEAGATSARLADVVRQRINSRRDFSVLPQGQPSLTDLMNLEKNAKQRENNRYPEQSSIRRGSGGRGVPSRSEDPVRISPQEVGRITSAEITRRMSEKDANRNTPLTRREVPIPVRSRPTPPTNRPTSRTSITSTPLTPAIRDERRAASGSSGEGSIPKGSKLYRQVLRGISVGDDPFTVMQSAATPTKPLPKPKPKPKPKSSRGGGGSTSRSRNAGTSSGNILPRSASERSGLPRSFRLGAAGSGDMMAN